MTLPEKIYLPRAAARAHTLRQDGWAEHEYVRGDIYAAALAVNEALRAEIESLKQPDTCTPIVPESEEWKFARDKVWKKWPGAYGFEGFKSGHGDWFWVYPSPPAMMHQCIGEGKTEQSAWIDAASRLSEGGNSTPIVPIDPATP